MKRLLCIVSNMDAGGAETFLMKLYRALDKSKYQMDFCVSGNSKGFYDDEILERGGRIFHIHRKTQNLFLFVSDLSRLIRRERYDHVLRICADCFGALDLWIAAFCGVKVRILRSSNASTTGGTSSQVLHTVLRMPMTSIANVKIAPSDLAAEYTFGKRTAKNGSVKHLPNAIDHNEYHYDETARTQIREELGLVDAFVVGHIGRFNQQKNHAFLLQTFAEIKKKHPKSQLVLVGKGKLEEHIRSQAEALNIQDSVIMTGIRSDIPALLSAFDIFLFPSFFEGMPNTVIEAQANGLPCIISDTITREADITGLVTYLPLGNAEIWAKKALAYCGEDRKKDTLEDFKKNGYEISSVVKEFEELCFQ